VRLVSARSHVSDGLGSLGDTSQTFFDIYRGECGLYGLDLTKNVFDLRADAVEVSALHGYAIKAI
jgi:hypothetical protein